VSVTNLFARFRKAAPIAAPPLPPPAPPASPELDNPRLTAALEHAQKFIDLVPVTYAAARAKYPFLPVETPAHVAFWTSSSSVGRAAFLLDYIARIYQATGLEGAMRAQLPPKPTAAFRTSDHPAAASVAHQDPRCYTLFFELDAGVRVELHMGHPSYQALGMVFGAQGRRGN
jgi:hypothetical protein